MKYLTGSFKAESHRFDCFSATSKNGSGERELVGQALMQTSQPVQSNGEICTL